MLTINTQAGSNGSINISPNGTGSANLTFSGASAGNSQGMITATDANLTSTSLYYGSVASNATGYNLLQLQSGSALTNKFVVDNAGNSSQAGTLTFGSGAGTIQSTGTNALVLGGSTTGNITLDPLNHVAGGYIAPNTTNVSDLGTSSLLWRNVYATKLYQGTYQACDTSGNCSSVGNLWSSGNGTIYPGNTTVDVLIGNSATSSAKFAFKNV